MSNKKSNKKSSGATIDETLITPEEKKAPVAVKSVSLKEYSKNAPYSFPKQNYKLLFIGLAINIIGFLLMIGGATDDPNKFDAGTLFSTTRITIAPMFIVLGYAVIMYAIMKKPKEDSSQVDQ